MSFANNIHIRSSEKLFATLWGKTGYRGGLASGGHWLKGGTGGHTDTVMLQASQHPSSQFLWLYLPSIWSVTLEAGTDSLARVESLHCTSLHNQRLQQVMKHGNVQQEPIKLDKTKLF